MPCDDLRDDLTAHPSGTITHFGEYAARGRRVEESVLSEMTKTATPLAITSPIARTWPLICQDSRIGL